MDNTFHVFVGQVGFWLPWDPEPSNISDEEYTESQLNDLVKNYKLSWHKVLFSYEIEK